MRQAESQHPNPIICPLVKDCTNIKNICSFLLPISNSEEPVVITSPPYYMKREYLGGGIGLEESFEEYVNSLIAICKEVYRVLKPIGSFWLNLGCKC